ncbi:MAG TPA: LamG domain-containing protein, partial [Candidatus Saccharimonadales bacterium]|nr:LamG domain-containing protein [Candidatus Saccharimonadales bacterium]
MKSWLNKNILKQNILKLILRRWGKLGLTLIIGAILVVIIGGGVALAQLGGVGHQSSSSDIALQKGLVSWWKFNDNVKDSTPYANNGIDSSGSVTGTLSSWTATTSLPAATVNHTSVVYNGYVYEIGGYTTTTSATVDYALINANGTIGSWTATNSLPVATLGETSVVYNGYVYEIGGCISSCTTASATVDYSLVNTGATLTTDREGQANQAYSFNGTNNVINTTNLITNPAVFTESLWFETSTTSGGVLIGFGNSQSGVSSNYDRMVYMTNSGNLIFGVYNGAIYDIATSGTFNDGKWHLVTATIGPAGMVLYVDGSQVGTNSNTAPQSYGGYWDIGYDNLSGWPSPSTSDYFTGSISDVRVYNRVLSSAEVTALYSEYNASVNTDVGEATLVDWWKLNGNTKNSTPYGNNCTNTGATLTTDREGMTNNAYNFNGTSNYMSCGISSLSPAINGSKTMSAWIELTSYGTYDIVDLLGSSIGDQFRTTPSGTLQVSKYAGGTVLTGSTVLSLNTWYLVTYTYDGTTNRLYIDGLPDTTSTVSPQSGSSTSVLIGSYGSGEYFKGSISDVRIYNTALAATQISSLYKSYNAQ